jgi:NAD(P)-dependent dehydrogenase (short-subunit alcohol dehydrogenase family)
MKKVIVTGGNRGIGKAIVRNFALNGYNVAFSYSSSQDTAEQTANEIKQITGRSCNYFRVDFTDTKAAVSFMQKAIESLGGLDILVNNAAITKTHFEIFDLKEDFITRLMNANFTSPIICMREAAVYMAKNEIQGSIINISSIRGMDHVAFPHDAIYASAKAGINRAIQSFALTLAPYGVRINNVAPGAVRNKNREESLASGISADDIDFSEEFARNKIPLARPGEPKDIAQAVAFLASDTASYITGITLTIDGGLTLAGMPERRRKPDEADKGWGYVKKRTQFE